MKSLEDGNSGVSGVAKHSLHSVPSSIVALPDVPAIPQKVRFFTARNTFIAESIADSSVESMSAIQFDAFIAPLFGAIPDINREEWTLADRIYALNTALTQQEKRIADQQIYIRLDVLPNGYLLISAIHPQVPAIKTDEDEVPIDAA